MNTPHYDAVVPGWADAAHLARLRELSTDDLVALISGTLDPPLPHHVIEFRPIAEPDSLEDAA